MHGTPTGRKSAMILTATIRTCPRERCVKELRKHRKSNPAQNHAK
jgi:hypothetical protein